MYYSGALDWHVSDFPPIESDTDLFRFRRNDAHFSRYAAAQLEELVERFAPDVLWNDIEWPDGGKGTEEYAVAALLQRYFDAVPDGVVNDRWGVPYHGFLTREYTDIPDIIPEPWESTRGLGYSFGFNQAEDERHSLSGAALIRLLVDVVAKNGNLLINVGPAADGSIPALQRKAMQELGSWLAVNGAAIYGTRPWTRMGSARGSSPLHHVHRRGARACARPGGRRVRAAVRAHGRCAVVGRRDPGGGVRRRRFDPHRDPGRSPRGSGRRAHRARRLTQAPQKGPVGSDGALRR